MNNLLPNCSDTCIDQIEHQSLLTNLDHKPISCNDTFKISCIPGHSHCFPMSKLCVYEVNTNNLSIQHCWNGAHLQKCEFFQCSGHFKSPNHYCIPYNYICDGKWGLP